ncbi:hypothetical protein F0562_011331 [Nyssa sinensis]|uniref:Uncharacterized protein n=1 Tax=Nyssa sinensis TaxID=561372 RepID=A0A5J5A4P2_9ASTE|nr:hypothetical protein F0562_011331 [Nyssa sinensis]
MWPSKKPYWASSFSCSVSVLVLSLVSLLLVVISFFSCTLGPEKSWISLSSPWVWRNRFSTSFSLASHEEKTPQSLLEEKSFIETSVNGSTSWVKRGTRLERVEAILAKARSAIKEAALIRNMTSTHEDPDYVPQGAI